MSAARSYARAMDMSGDLPQLELPGEPVELGGQPEVDSSASKRPKESRRASGGRRPAQPDDARAPRAAAAAAPSRPEGEGSGPSLDGLSIAGITRKRAAWVLAAAVTIWIVVVFARQVSDATAAGVRADRMRASNDALAAQVQDLQQEQNVIQRQAYIELAARSYGLGTANERPFAISPDAPPLPPDAPGSAAVRLGVQHRIRSPLDSWLTVLFGPTPGS